MNQKKNIYFFVWFLVLWGILSWALIELTFPRSSYMPFVLPTFIAIILSVSVLYFMGKGLFGYFSQNEPNKKHTEALIAAFIAATLVLTIIFTPCIITSFNNKDRVQWYIDDLKSQGFNAEYYAQYPYNRGPVSHVYSYENFTSLAKELNCTWVGVYGGAPYYFLFFFPSNTFFLINQHGQYTLSIYW